MLSQEMRRRRCRLTFTLKFCGLLKTVWIPTAWDSMSTSWISPSSISFAPSPFALFSESACGEGGFAKSEILPSDMAASSVALDACSAFGGSVDTIAIIMEEGRQESKKDEVGDEW